MKASAMSSRIKRDLGESADLVIRPAVVAGKEAYYIAIEGLVDKEMLEERVIKPLSKEGVDLSRIDEQIYLSSPIKRARSAAEAVGAIVEGATALVTEGEKDIYLFSAKKWERRAVEEPPTSSVINPLALVRAV